MAFFLSLLYISHCRDLAGASVRLGNIDLVAHSGIEVVRMSVAVARFFKLVCHYPSVSHIVKPLCETVPIDDPVKG